ncbi:MAG: type II toxin-antitoxin system YafQ family toxin [Bacteroidetes bacterium]|nr:type II toxin-antitoxin system YafQ family toxin [Bacteroidota bacterium]
MYTIVRTPRFNKDWKKVKKSGIFPFDDLQQVLACLKKGEKLPAKFDDHALTGEMKGLRDCHLMYDLILMYWIDKPAKEVYLARLGTHSSLF